MRVKRRDGKWDGKFGAHTTHLPHLYKFGTQVSAGLRYHEIVKRKLINDSSATEQTRRAGAP